MIRIETDSFDPEATLAGFRAKNRSAGAITSFVGCVRGDAADVLVLEHHPVLTRYAIQSFAAQVRERFSLEDILAIHRVGAMMAGEPIVLVAAASAHRRAALDAVDMLMDLLKTEAPFWKREVRDGQAHWVEPRPDDYAARTRWTAPSQEND